MLLWHMTRDEFLVRDFFIHWLYPVCYESTAFAVRQEDLRPYLLTLGRRGGVTEHVWSESTFHRVATGLLRMAEDFGFLEGEVLKCFTSYELPERSFSYIVRLMYEAGGSRKTVIASKEWRMFLMRPSDVEQKLSRLKLGKVEAECATIT